MEIEQGMLYNLFMWCLGLCEKFTGTSWLCRAYGYKTNLCHLVRVICLYTPLIIISNFLFYGMVISIFILPIFLFGSSQILFAILIMAGAFISLGMIVGLVYLFVEDIIQDWIRDRFQKNEFFSVISEYIKAKKAKICPYIYFKGSK